MKNSKIALATSAIACSLVLSSCGLSEGEPSAPPPDEAGGTTGSGEATTIVIAHTGPPENSVNNFFAAFAEEISERTEGRLEVEMHPAGELGGDQDLVEGLRLGSIDIASAATSNMASYTDAYSWVDLPYIFEDNESALTVWDSGIADGISEQVSEDVGTKVLGYLNAGGFRLLANTERQVKAPEDAAGLKIRTTDSPLEAAITRAWGANPTPVAWADTFPALEQGVVEGLQLQPEWLNLNGFGNVVTHATEVEALVAFHVVQVSDEFWTSLSAEDQALLEEVAAEVSESSNAQMAEDRQAHIDALAEDGVELYTPAEAELASFREAAKATWESYEDQELLEEVLALQEAG